LSHSTTFFLFAICVGFLVGGLLGTQPSINGSLGKSVAFPLQASLISFASGTVILLLLNLIVGGGVPLEFVEAPSRLPWWTWMGGALGVVYVSTSLLLVPRIGSLPWFAAAMTGQIMIAILLDHYGLLGNPKAPVSALRLIGTLFLILGILAIVAGRQMEQKQSFPDGGSQRDRDGKIDNYVKRKPD
jgi:transporter family-2 protein